MNQLMVAAPPITIDDTEWQEIIAYDLNGVKRILSAKKPPQEPVLVITPCEHHGDHSIPSKSALNKILYDPGWRMTILDFLLYDDHEPWSSGDAEIYVKLLDGGHWYSTDCCEINHEGNYYNYDKAIYPIWASQPSGQRMFEVWEEDDTSADDLVEKYWHWPNEGSSKTRYVDVSGIYTYTYYGDHNDADLTMRTIYY